MVAVISFKTTGTTNNFVTLNDWIVILNVPWQLLRPLPRIDLLVPVSQATCPSFFPTGVRLDTAFAQPVFNFFAIKIDGEILKKKSLDGFEDDHVHF